jgi:anti-anti-sigma factor
MSEPRQPLTIVIDGPTDDGVKLTVGGEIDFRQCDLLVREVADHISTGADAMALTLNVRGVTFCDSAGVAALMAIRQACDRASWTLILSEVSPFLRRVLDMTSLSTWFGLTTP